MTLDNMTGITKGSYTGVDMFCKSQLITCNRVKECNGVCPFEDALKHTDKTQTMNDQHTVDHDRKWIIGCIEHDGFIHTHRFDKANQIILDALDHHTETETNVDKEGKHGRLIDAEWLLKGVSVNLCDFIDCGNCPFYQDQDCLVMLWIDNAPTVEVGRPCKTCGYYEHECPKDCEYCRPHGEWEHWGSPFSDESEVIDTIVCSVCGERFIEPKDEPKGEWRFCPNCGAQMDMRGDNNDK